MKKKKNGLFDIAATLPQAGLTQQVVDPTSHFPGFSLGASVQAG